MFYALKSLNDDTDFIKAEDVTAENQSKNYYCPCISCKCKFGFRSLHSNKKNNCFFKLPSSTHSDSCFVPYVRSEEGNKYDYETKSLSAEDFLERLEGKTKENTKASLSKLSQTVRKVDERGKEIKPITTLRQLYYVCASNEPSTKLNDTLRVIDIFAGRNTLKLYTKYINDIKLVECKFMNRYDTDKQLLYFTYPFTEPRFELVVKIASPKTYFEIRKVLWDFNEPVIIYAKWDYSHCIIKSKRQIVPLR